MPEVDNYPNNHQNLIALLNMHLNNRNSNISNLTDTDVELKIDQVSQANPLSSQTDLIPNILTTRIHQNALSHIIFHVTRCTYARGSTAY